MTAARACACGADISDRPAWQSQCWPCWRRDNPAGSARGRGRWAARGDAVASGLAEGEAIAAEARAPLEGRIRELEREVRDARRAQAAAENDAQRARASGGLGAGERAQLVAQIAMLTLQVRSAEASARGRNGSAGGLPADLLPLMIRLCHPDKHGGSEMANRVTAWLLGQRRTS